MDQVMFNVAPYSVTNTVVHPFPFTFHVKHLEQIAMILETLPFGGHLRLINPDRYILANLTHARQLGLKKIEDVTNVSYFYIATHRKHCIKALGGDLAKEAAYQRFVCDANEKVIYTKKPCHFEVCTLFPTGFLYIGNVKKIPLLDGHKKVIAILTFSEDTTKRSELIDLYNLYQDHYSFSKSAIHQFIKYLNLTSMFNNLPTHRELLTLLMFCKDARAKYVARQLNLSDRTVEEYKSRLRYKLKKNLSLEALLFKLRHPTYVHFDESK